MGDESSYAMVQYQRQSIGYYCILNFVEYCLQNPKRRTLHAQALCSTVN